MGIKYYFNHTVKRILEKVLFLKFDYQLPYNCKDNF